MKFSLVNSLYKNLMIVCSPFLKMYFYSRCLYGKDRVESVKNHFGIATIKRPAGDLVWIHAASVGESISALTYIRHLQETNPDISVLLTTVTVTSADIIKSKNIRNCYHQFAVVDNPFWVKKFLNYWKPCASIFLESEIWPNIIDALSVRGIPTYLLNARLSPGSFNRWKILKTFLSDKLKKFRVILAQSKLDQERFEFFSSNNVVKIDNLKYANAALPCSQELLQLFKPMCKNKKVLVAASTHPGEDEVLIEAYRKLRERFNMILFIIPRHTTRVKDICSLLAKRNIDFALRSKTDQNTRAGVICVDSFGEVGTFFTLADMCFVGGSLVPIGGHNIYEPVAMGKPVLHGKYMENALEVRDFLHRENVAFEVNSEADIVSLCTDFFADNSLLKSVSNHALSLSKNDSLQQIDEIIKLKFKRKSG